MYNFKIIIILMNNEIQKNNMIDKYINYVLVLIVYKKFQNK